MAKGDTRLGKGLGALLGEYLEEAQSAAGPEKEVPIEAIRSNPFQPRTRFPDEALGELAASIRRNGLLQPLVVRPAGEGWQIVAGERRWRALRQLEWENVPVIVRDLTDEQMLVLALVENLQREDLGPLDEARGYQQLIDDFGLSRQEVGAQVGRDRSTVSNTLRLLALPETVQELLAEGAITAGHGRAILGLEEEKAQIALARRAANDGLSVRQTEERVRRARDDGSSPAEKRGSEGGRTKSAPDPTIRRAEQSLERALGTQVRVTERAKGAGEIRIRFHDAGDFRRLFEMLAGSEASALFDAR